MQSSQYPFIEIKFGGEIMKKMFFKKETVKSKNFLTMLVLVILFFAIGITAIQSKYAVAIDPQKISESMKNQKKSDGEYYSAYYELNETEFRTMVENANFKETIIKKEELGYKIICQNNGKKYIFNVITENKLAEIHQFLQENNDKVKISFEKPPSMKGLWGLLGIMLIVFIFVLSFNMINNTIRSRRGGAGSTQFNETKKFTQARIEIFKPGDIKTTFNDVAGCDESKLELQEVIDFLKNPNKYRKLGGKIPKGVLLVGFPGCGKTLLAKATAGEAGVPFLTLSGSSFVEMFVGVGSARIRDLFEQAKKNTPCIAFIDEIDCLGKKRTAGPNSHDEKDQTLTEFLTLMDGFQDNSGLIVIGATNRPDSLDPAFKRPGRFDRTIVVDKPDIKGRIGILKVHTKNILIAPDEKETIIKTIAERTPGFSGADLAAVANEAAMLAARYNKEKVSLEEFNSAMMRVLTGIEQKSKLLGPKEKNIVAHHEAGHAVIQFFIEKKDVHKISIIRTERALGYTFGLATEDKYLHTKQDLKNTIKGLLGGRAAEEMLLKEISSGAQNDLERTTELAMQYTKKFGMDDKVGLRSFGVSQENYLGDDWSIDKGYSEKTAQQIDESVNSLLNDCYKETKEAIMEHKVKIKIIVQRLLEKEVLEKEEIEQILKSNS